ncbi:multiple monosaccharide ABC transporter substrate-binding protein [Glycomyces sp. NPDC021274]|jgi:putative multiple sugar transport system substrate-binding protein|uniref:multiple monosaccharide ABC transporter substrate-binding protein n=1 Tax=Glycomyces sp. NPDC021274 TaxID=3155120 RepID=UPI003404EAC7
MNVNRRHLLSGSVGAAAVALTASACASGDDSNGGDGEGGGGSVGIAMPTQSSERWIFDGENLVKEFEAAGYTTSLQYAEDNVEKQVNQIQTMVGQGVDVLVIAAKDNKSLTGVLAEAKAEGIHVIAYDRLILDTPDVDYYATFDNEKVGTLQGTYIAEALGLATQAGPFNIELFAGSLDDNNTKYFFKGAMDVLQPFIDEGKLVVKSGQVELDAVATQDWSGDNAQNRMDNILSTYYSGGDKVNAVLSPYDGISRGIISSLESDGYVAGTDLPVVTGQDAEVASIQYIKDGRQAQTVYKDTRLLASTTVDMVVALMEGETPATTDETTYDNGVRVVPANLLEPVSVDVNNYQEVVIDSGYIDAGEIK